MCLCVCEILYSNAFYLKRARWDFFHSLEFFSLPWHVIQLIYVYIYEFMCTALAFVGNRALRGSLYHRV